MKINSINTYNNSFKGVKAVHKKTAQDLLGKNLTAFEALSELKSLDVWALEINGGCMFNPQSGYMVVLKDKNSDEILKQIECSSNQKSIDKLNEDLEESLIWAHAGNNQSIARTIETSPAINNPEIKRIANELKKSGSSPEASIWRQKLDMIG